MTLQNLTTLDSRALTNLRALIFWCIFIFVSSWCVDSHAECRKELELGEDLEAKKEDGDTYMAEIEVSFQNFEFLCHFQLQILYLGSST